MATIIINISENLNSHMQNDNGYCEEIGRELYEKVRHGIVLPDNATNGDMLLAVFPKEVKDVDVDWFGEEWWNSPYGEDEGDDK